MAKFEINGKTFTNQSEFIKRGYRCATDVPNQLERERTRNEISLMRSAMAPVQNVTINVQFIHITNGNKGRITEDERVKQMKVLNNAYSNTGIQFSYNPETVKSVDKPAWFNMGHISAAEREAKTALHIPPEYSLNFYTAGLQGGLLGWATFPDRLQGDKVMDGVVILHSTLPGGTAAPYNQGETATHEVGHWLGLYHTFQDGCSGEGDEVQDTEAHAGPNFGCKNTLTDKDNFCSGETQAPLKNFMNYVDDKCMSEFTPGQIARMKDMITTYRSGLIVGP